MEAIREFFEQGKGLFLWGDNDPFHADANAVSSVYVNHRSPDYYHNIPVSNIFLYRILNGTNMSGNEYGCQVVQEAPSTGAMIGFLPHLITTGLKFLYEGHTIATVHPTIPGIDYFFPLFDFPDSTFVSSRLMYVFI